MHLLRGSVLGIAKLCWCIGKIRMLCCCPCMYISVLDLGRGARNKQRLKRSESLGPHPSRLVHFTWAYVTDVPQQWRPQLWRTDRVDVIWSCHFPSKFKLKSAQSVFCSEKGENSKFLVSSVSLLPGRNKKKFFCSFSVVPWQFPALCWGIRNKKTQKRNWHCLCVDTISAYQNRYVESISQFTRLILEAHWLCKNDKAMIWYLSPTSILNLYWKWSGTESIFHAKADLWILVRNSSRSCLVKMRV